MNPIDNSSIGSKLLDANYATMRMRMQDAGCRMEFSYQKVKMQRIQKIYARHVAWLYAPPSTLQWFRNPESNCIFGFSQKLTRLIRIHNIRVLQMSFFPHTPGCRV
jgi:hypothetical protein